MTDHTDELTAMAQEDGLYGDIKPRIDKHGVGLCEACCPMAKDPQPSGALCLVDDTFYPWALLDIPCPHHARRVAEERDRLRARLAKMVFWGEDVLDWIKMVGDHMDLEGAFSTSTDASGVEYMTLIERRRRKLLATYPGEEE
jgi:hypothetical protein